MKKTLASGLLLVLTLLASCTAIIPDARPVATSTPEIPPVIPVSTVIHDATRLPTGTISPTIAALPDVPSTLAPVQGERRSSDDVRGFDLSGKGSLGRKQIEMLWFDKTTKWSPDDEPVAKAVLELGMNPGMGVRNLHAQGITGKGVTVAILDQPVVPEHPEILGKIVRYFDVGTASPVQTGSMHGPAVTSLLVGNQTGTAPDAQVYFVAVPSWFLDAQYYATALDWIVAENEKLPPDNKIRVVSVSAIPSGLWTAYTKNLNSWEEAYQRATAAGLLVLDCTFEHGITSRCRYNLDEPDNISGCIPEYLGPTDSPHQRIYIPTSHRSQATEGMNGDVYGYQYTGNGGDSWTTPYLAGVLAMGWQVNPALSNAQILDLLYASAYVNKDQKLIINPPEFIRRVQATLR